MFVVTAGELWLARLFGRFLINIRLRNDNLELVILYVDCGDMMQLTCRPSV